MFTRSPKNKNIIFIGYIPYSEISNYYFASDIATLLSRCNETCGLVGIEAMAAGLPIIATDRGVIGEYISKACKIITPDDDDLIENISEVLKKLVYDKELCMEMGKEGMGRAKRRRNLIKLYTFKIKKNNRRSDREWIKCLIFMKKKRR